MSDVVAFVQSEFRTVADTQNANAIAMAAYMKTDMAFYGVQKPGRTKIMRQVKAQFSPSNAEQYVERVLALWVQLHREEKYLAIAYARTLRDFVTSSHLDLYARLIREGAWWDFGDEISINLVGAVHLSERPQTEGLMDKWVSDSDMWIRRAAIISELNHKTETDEARLFRYCVERAHESEFFIRKAIGWALREHAKTARHAVVSLLLDNPDVWSALTFREAAKHLDITRA